ncbi:MAG TPA: hypothetical protein VG125_08400 [Pirellulales bacterium]|jgi:hypothetical protein|nr:hypothetical protein [Pirellulales bacterium]
MGYLTTVWERLGTSHEWVCKSIRIVWQNLVNVQKKRFPFDPTVREEAAATSIDG